MNDPRADKGRELVVEFLHRLDLQSGLLDELESLASRQASLIERGDGTELAGLLGRREQVLASYVEAQTELIHAAGSIDSDGMEISIDQRRRIRDGVAGLQERLQSLMQRDDRDRLLLEQACGSLGAELREATATQAARRAYATGEPGQPNRFADRMA
ncbi:MAG: hypothetical protein CMJ32_11670 [Phycisphaerae bacterium]|nr:hypothetical protein [Phycisphaerae bacterium]